jgi:hypothetical protein
MSAYFSGNREGEWIIVVARTVPDPVVPQSLNRAVERG